MKDNYFQDEKLKYEEIEIPDELLLMVRRTVAKDRRKKQMRARARVLRAAGSVAAILFLCLTIGVNSSYAFAEAAVKIPIVKNVAQAVVMRSYRQEIIEVYRENKSGSESNVKPGSASEKAPDEPVVTESGNEAPVPEEIETSDSQGQTEQIPEEVLSGSDAWKAEMTPEKLREVTEIYSRGLEEKYADAPEKLRTVLLAALQKEDISLYGYHENGATAGTILRIGDKCRYFDWNYMNESGKLPELFWEDINGDGEKEVAVLLYNGTPQKKEISKEDIKAPRTETVEDTADVTQAAKTDDSGKQKSDDGSVGTDEGKAVSGEETNSSKTPSKENASPDEVKNAASGENAAGDSGADASSVSGNDITAPVKSEEKAVQPAGELWVVTLADETWSAAVLSVDDYESQILHGLRAKYDAEAGTLQLYLVEEPFGEPVKLDVEAPDKLTYESIELAPARTFSIKDGITLRFKPEALFREEEGETVSFPLERELEAEIHLEDDSLVLENIRELQ